MGALKMRSIVASHYKLVMTNWEPSSAIEADPLTATGEIVQELNINHYMVIWHLKKIEKLKKIGKWMFHAAAAA